LKNTIITYIIMINTESSEQKIKIDNLLEKIFNNNIYKICRNIILILIIYVLIKYIFF